MGLIICKFPIYNKNIIFHKKLLILLHNFIIFLCSFQMSQRKEFKDDASLADQYGEKALKMMKSQGWTRGEEKDASDAR